MQFSVFVIVTASTFLNSGGVYRGKKNKKFINLFKFSPMDEARRNVGMIYT
jgi:hypothetical protein